MSSGEKRLQPWPRWPKPTHVIYALALAVAAALLFGEWGVVIAWMILCFWFVCCRVTPPPQTPHTLDVQVGFLLLFSSLVVAFISFADYLNTEHTYGVGGIPSFQRWEGRPRFNKNERVAPLLGRALAAYQGSHGNLPPAFIADQNGTPMHSWRVLLLPYLGQQRVYDQYKFDEPWDSPHNSRLVGKIPPATFSWGLNGMATMKLVTGRNTIYPNHRQPYYDPAVRTTPPILLVEDTASPICWMKPEDLTIDQTLKVFDRKASPETMLHVDERYFWLHNYYAGSVRDASGEGFVVGTLDDPQILRPYFIATEEPKLPLKELPFKYSRVTSELRTGQCLLVGANVFLVLLPIVWRRR